MESIKGQTIVNVREMTEEEREREFWDYGTIVLELNDGSIIYPSRDIEGNGPGELFGFNPEVGSTFFVRV